VPKLPVNMVKKSGRPGFYFRRKMGGKTFWTSLGTDYEAARARVRELKAEEPKAIARTLVKDAVAKWLDKYIATARNPKGQVMAKTRARLYLVPALGHLLLGRVRPDHLRDYRLYLEKRGLATLSVAHLLSDARCFFRWCEDAGMVERSPFPRKLMPRIQERPPDRLTDDEAEVLRRLPDPWGFVARLALGTGLRWGELTRAQASDMERGFLVVHHTKSGKVRRVPLGVELLAEVRGRVGKLVPYSNKSPGSFAAVVRRATGIERFHVHQMRHTFACQWLERGGSLAALQQILGHASIETTQRYARLTDEVVMREVERMEGRVVPKGVPNAR